MFFSSQRKDLKSAQSEAQKILNGTGTKPKVLSVKNLSTFWGELGYSFRLIVEEKEIILFAILQWLVIGIAYSVWTQILDWIPESLWEEVKKSSSKDDKGAFLFINLVLVGWSILVVVVASYPLSLLNAAITAAHYLRSSNQTSTIAKCCNLACKHLGRLWVFTAMDAWITLRAILTRLPRKRKRRKAFNELLYYAWKIGTVGVLPALVAGKSYMEAAEDSVSLLKNKPERTIGIRMGYSLVCWIIGITAYIGSIYYFWAFGIGNYDDKANAIYNIYSIVALPIFIAAGITLVLARPFFLVMISKLYTDIVTIDEEVTALKVGRKFDALAFFFAILLCILLTLYFFGDQLGIRAWIESLAAKDIERYQQ